MFNWLTLDLRPFTKKPVAAQVHVPAQLKSTIVHPKGPAVVPLAKAEHARPKRIQIAATAA